MKAADPHRVHTVSQGLRRTLGNRLTNEFAHVFKDYSDQDPYQFTPKDAGRRALKNRALAYLLSSDNVDYRNLALAQFKQSNNMTDRLGALSPLSAIDCDQRLEALEQLETQFRHDPLVMDKWFALQATAPLPDTLDRVKQLMEHPLFTIKTPNRVRALIGAFCHGNLYCFHDLSGAGYDFLTDRVLELNQINPQIAARLLTAMSQWRTF